MAGMAASAPGKPEGRPVDYVAGRWPDGPLRPATGDDGGAVAIAAQVVRLIQAIVARREVRGLRRSQLAGLTGLRRNTISDLENGQTWPDAWTLATIAEALEADLEFVPREALRRADLRHVTAPESRDWQAEA